MRYAGKYKKLSLLLGNHFYGNLSKFFLHLCLKSSLCRQNQHLSHFIRIFLPTLNKQSSWSIRDFRVRSAVTLKCVNNFFFEKCKKLFQSGFFLFFRLGFGHWPTRLDQQSSLNIRNVSFQKNKFFQGDFFGFSSFEPEISPCCPCIHYYIRNIFRNIRWKIGCFYFCRVIFS